MKARPSPRVSAAWAVVCLAAANILIAARLFALDYSPYNNSIEGTFIALPRLMAKYPGQWRWWPFWNGGLPFENAYLPFSHCVVAAFQLLTGFSAARSFHIVSAIFYVCGASAVFWMALEFSGRLIVSFFAALAYSCVSVSALISHDIAADAGGILSLRRFQDLVVYGEAPHTAALALLPVFLVFFSRALTRPEARWKILAGISAACVVLSNAFGIVALALAALCWLLVFPASPWWRAPLVASMIGIVSFLWISPWLSPAMIRGIRANSLIVGGDFHYARRNYLALAAVCAVLLLAWSAMRRWNVRPCLQFFALLGLGPAAFVVVSRVWGIALIPQPNRYEMEMDLWLSVAAVFAAAGLLERLPFRARHGIAWVAFGLLLVQMAHAAIYANRLVRAVDPAWLSEYRVAKWLDQYLPGQRAYLPGSDAFWFNVFSDNPQLTGGHDQHTVNTFIPIAAFAIYSGLNAGNRGAESSTFWLKAYGVRAIAVPSEGSTEAFKPFVHPHKFDGVLPLLWRDRGDSIYGVPSRSASLAHVIPVSAIVARRPIHGLDTAPAEAYIAALDDPTYPPTTFRWRNLSEAHIHSNVQAGQAVAVQVTYEKGWEAWANGRKQKVRGDGLGQLVIEPDCAGPCEIDLRYTGGAETVVTHAMSWAAMLIAAVYALRRRYWRSDAMRF
jgi:hypothetical protein